MQAKIEQKAAEQEHQEKERMKEEKRQAMSRLNKSMSLGITKIMQRIEQESHR